MDETVPLHHHPPDRQLRQLMSGLDSSAPTSAQTPPFAQRHFSTFEGEAQSHSRWQPCAREHSSQS